MRPTYNIKDLHEIIVDKDVSLYTIVQGNVGKGIDLRVLNYIKTLKTTSCSQKYQQFLACIIQKKIHI